MAHILVVDDDAATRDAIRWVLAEDGHEVVEAADGRLALATMRASRHPLVVLLDLLMPGMSGIAVLREVAADESLRSRHAVVLMTASPPAPNSAVAAVLAQLGASAVDKPFNIDDLLAAVAQAARKLTAA
jgi:CheY-like chemotaxis protein